MKVFKCILIKQMSLLISLDHPISFGLEMSGHGYLEVKEILVGI